jgi:predicted DNA binding CopG/RHH family protein
MKSIEWSKEKDAWLKETRGIGFQNAADIIRNNKLVDVINNPNQKKYPLQRIYVMEIRKYIWMVTFVEDEEKIFLKIIYQSRKYMKKYQKGVSMKQKAGKVKENTGRYTTDVQGVPLDKEEQWIEDHLDEYVSIPNLEEEKKRYQQVAISTMNKNKNINLRLQARDVSKLKDIAAHEGIPYQTLAASVLHKFANSYKFE